MVSLVALALMTYNVFPLEGKTGVYLMDPCMVNDQQVGFNDLPRKVGTGIDKDKIDLLNGTARLEIWDTNNELVGEITLVGRTQIVFGRGVSLFPVGVTLNLGTIDNECDPHECEITVDADSCSVVTMGTHFQVEKTSNNVCVTVFSGSVKVSPDNSTPVLLRTDEVGRVADSLGLPNPVHRSSLSRSEKQAHIGGPAHY